MENKKKSGLIFGIVSVVIVLCAALVLYLVQPGMFGAKKTAGGNAVTFDLSVTLDGGEEVIYNSEVTADGGASLIDVLAENVTENGGVVYSDGEYGAYITEICGHAENPAESRYWVYTVNGEQAMVGASDYYPAEGDEIVFDLSVFEW